MAQPASWRLYSFGGLDIKRKYTTKKDKASNQVIKSGGNPLSLVLPFSSEITNVERTREKTSIVVNAVKYYSDFYALKSNILNENKNKSGVYKFTNKLNGNFYIGSSKPSFSLNCDAMLVNAKFPRKTLTLALSQCTLRLDPKFDTFNFCLTQALAYAAKGRACFSTS